MYPPTLFLFWECENCGGKRWLEAAWAEGWQPMNTTDLVGASVTLMEQFRAANPESCEENAA